MEKKLKTYIAVIGLEGVDLGDKFGVEATDNKRLGITGSLVLCKHL
jgi:hypothetical protein